MSKLKYLWASPHKMTEEQKDSLEGWTTVTKLEDINPVLQNKLSNIQLDTDLRELAIELVEFTSENEFDCLVQPAGSPAFQFELGKEWDYCANVVEFPKKLFKIIYSFNQRVSEDIPQADGTIKKVSLFKHEGWV